MSTTPARSAVRLEARGRTPDGVVDEVGRLYDGADWSARTTDQPFTYRYTAVGDTAVTLRRSLITGWIRGGIRPDDDYIVQWLTEGQGVPDVTTDRVPMHLGRPMLFPTARDFVFEYQDSDQRLVHLSRDLVHQVAEERFHVLPVDDLRLDHLRTPDPVQAARFRDQMGLLARELRNGVDTLMWDTLTRDAATAFLALYPPRVPTMPPPLLVPRRARLRSAAEYVHEHVAEPIRVGDLAAPPDSASAPCRRGSSRRSG